MDCMSVSRNLHLFLITMVCNCSDTFWNQEVRNGNLTGPVGCQMEGAKEGGHFLFFSDNAAMQERSGRAIIASRLITTTPLDLMKVETEATAPPNLAPPRMTPPDGLRDADELGVAIRRRIGKLLELVGFLNA